MSKYFFSTLVEVTQFKLGQPTKPALRLAQFNRNRQLRKSYPVLVLLGGLEIKHNLHLHTK